MPSSPCPCREKGILGRALPCAVVLALAGDGIGSMGYCIYWVNLLGQFTGSIYWVNLPGQFIGSIYWVNLPGQFIRSIYCVNLVII